MSKKEQLYALLNMFLRGAYRIPVFCDAFEDIYYPDVPRQELSAQELIVFDTLASIVTRFSPFSEDISAYPNVYRTEDEVRNAILSACNDLGLVKNRNR